MKNFTYATLSKGTRHETRVRRCVVCGQPDYYRPGAAPRGPCLWKSQHSTEQRAKREYTGPAA